MGARFPRVSQRGQARFKCPLRVSNQNVEVLSHCDPLMVFSLLLQDATLRVGRISVCRGSLAGCGAAWSRS